ncbi:FAD-binding protein [Neorhizobium sp. Rsf11]|uniref:FAD-binding protein n=1 Tax=Neorhizobium phenanthreniclasticum TaxID=3157917 RepID=A0ABV0M9G2_9HYPH
MAIDKRAAQHPDLAGPSMFSRDPQDLAEAADDFGHVVQRRPQAVLKAASVADIADLVRWAASRGLKVAARGQGHSTYGRAAVDGGIVIEMKAINTIHYVQPDHMVVDAGATWSAVLDAALAYGLTPPVLPNYLELSVGGTLAVGGIGGTTFRHGMQTDNVLALNVVTGDGRELTCSEDVNPDLFDAVRAGLGQCGIITRATLRLMRAPERVRRFHLFYSDLRSLTADQRTALADGRFDYLQGAVLPDGAGTWQYQLEGVVFYDGAAVPDDKAVLAGLSDQRSAADISDVSYSEDVRAFARLENLLRSNGQWFNPHPWLLTFLPGSCAEQIASDILNGLTNEDVGPFGRITFYPLLTGALRTPLLRLPDESVVFPFNLVRIPTSSGAVEAEQLVARNRMLYEHIRDAGGILYPVSALPMSRDDWRSHFGPKWSFLDGAKRRYDPLGAFAPGYELF